MGLLGVHLYVYLSMSNPKSRQNTPRGYKPRLSPVEKICVNCGAGYVPTRNMTITKYCSPECARLVRQQRHRENVARMADEGKMWGRESPEYYFRVKRQYAEKRGIPWDLTVGQFRLLWERECYYCGDVVKRGGIDRLDSLLGYSGDNCVPSCGTCNMMKRTMGVQEFVDHCAKIVSRLALGPSGVGDVPDPPGSRYRPVSANPIEEIF